MTRTRSHLRGPALTSLFSAGGVLVFLFGSGILSARTLGPVERGHFAVVTLVPNMLCQLAALGISLALVHFVASGKIGARQAVSLLKPIIAVQCVAVFVIALLVGEVLNLNRSSHVQIAAAIAPLAVISSFGRDYGLALLQACGRVAEANALRVLPAAIWSGAIAVVYVVERGSLIAAITAFVAGDLLASAIIAARARVAVVASPTPAGCTTTRAEILRYGRRIYAGVLSPLENFNLDQFTVSLLHSPAGLGYYAIAASFTNISRVVAMNIGLTASPLVSAAHNRGYSPQAAARAFIGFTLAVTIAITVVLQIATTVLIPKLFGDDFLPAVPICHVLLLSGPIMAARRILVDTKRGAGRAVGSRAELLGMTTFVLLALWLGPAHGPIGIAWSFVAANGANLCLLVALEWGRSARARRG
ncbi:MAG: oligosaccharide flippase family protein [Patulibacter sp.]